MYTNLDRKVDRQEDPEPASERVVAPPELFTDGRVTQLTRDVEIVLRRRAARAHDCPWLR